MDHAPTTLSHREWRLLSVLAEEANDDTGLTWGSVQSPTVLRRAGLSRTQLYEVLRRLLEEKALEKVTVGQRNATAKYRILPQCPVQRNSEEPVQSPEDRDTERPQCPAHRDSDGKFSIPKTGTLTESQSPENRDTDDSQSPGQQDTDESQSPAQRDPYSYRERKNSLSPHAIEGAFAGFWREYPRKVGKQDAAKAFAAAIKSGASPEHITAAAIKHRAHWQAECRQPNFIPYPATWLRRGSYDDELHTPRQPPAQQRGLWADPTERGIF
jgi:hypothetical protein